MPSSSTTLSKNRSARVADGRVATVERVLNAYGLVYCRVLEPQQGYRNHVFPIELPTGELLNFTLHKRESGSLQLIRSASRVSAYAAERGLPCRQARSPIVRLKSSSGVVTYGALYNYLPGHTIPWEAYTKDHIKLLGLTLSNLHAALKPLPQAGLPNVVAVYEALLKRMERYFQDDGVQEALRRKLGLRVPFAQFAAHQRALKTCRKLPGQQTLHMDFVRGNILFQDEPEPASGFKVRISGILDFEKTAFGHPLFDIARTLAFLLVDCKYKPAAKVRKYFLYSGYAKRGQAPLPQVRFRLCSAGGTWRYHDLLDHLVDLFLLYDFYKFLRHNPYEALPHNEHFVRTKQLLIERELLLQ